MPLTPKQKNLLDFITEFQRKKGFAPSQAEIAKHFGYRSLGTVQDYLVRLRQEGFLNSTPHAKRGLLVKAQKSITQSGVNLPLLGQVAAGKPIEVFAEALGHSDDSGSWIEVPRSLVKKGENFVLQVVGYSMIEDGILDGDLIVVKKQSSAERGQTVVALVNDGATVKRFYPRNGRIELHPANPQFQPILVGPEQSFQIEGIVTGMIRQMGRRN